MQTYNDDKRFFNLSSDVYFKRFFSNKKVLAVFLSKLWNKNIKPEDIIYDNTEVTLKNVKKDVCEVSASVAFDGYQKEVSLYLEMSYRNIGYLGAKMDHYSLEKYWKAIEKIGIISLANVESIWFLGFDDIKNYVNDPNCWYDEVYLSTDEGKILNKHRCFKMIYLKNKDKCPITEVRKLLELFDIENKDNLPIVDSEELSEALNILTDMNNDEVLRAEAFSSAISK